MKFLIMTAIKSISAIVEAIKSRISKDMTPIKYDRSEKLSEAHPIQTLYVL